MSSNEGGQDFRLSGSDGAFGARAHDVFASLDSIEAKHATTVANTRQSEELAGCSGEAECVMKPDPLDEDDVLKQGSTARVQGVKRAHSGDAVDTYLQESQNKDITTKWKRYDLTDISTSQMSEHSNRAAAADFLALTKKQKTDETGEKMDEDLISTSEAGCSTTKHVFKRPAVSKQTCDSAVTSTATATLSSISQATAQVTGGWNPDDEEEDDNLSTTIETRTISSKPQELVVESDMKPQQIGSSKKKIVRHVRERGTHSDDDDNDDDSANNESNDANVNDAEKRLGADSNESDSSDNDEMIEDDTDREGGAGFTSDEEGEREGVWERGVGDETGNVDAIRSQNFGSGGVPDIEQAPSDEFESLD